MNADGRECLEDDNTANERHRSDGLLTLAVEKSTVVRFIGIDARRAPLQAILSPEGFSVCIVRCEVLLIG